MAKGLIVTTEVEAFIASIYQKHPKWKAKEVRNEVVALLRKNNPKLPSGWPSLSTVQKVLATVRKNIKETPIHPEDKPWSMGTLNEYPIPPDAIPAVLKVLSLVVETNLKNKNDDLFFSIRQAKWAARLSHFISDISDLFIWASRYAIKEKAFQIIDKPMDSTVEYDRSLIGFPIDEELEIAHSWFGTQPPYLSALSSFLKMPTNQFKEEIKKIKGTGGKK